SSVTAATIRYSQAATAASWLQRLVSRRTQSVVTPGKTRSTRVFPSNAFRPGSARHEVRDGRDLPAPRLQPCDLERRRPRPYVRTTNELEFRFLGPLQVTANGGSLPLGGAKQRAVLALLLLHANEVVSTDRLIDELWGEAPPASAANMLQGYVSHLRKTLE